MKKILAAALAATMLATMASVTAFAADTTMVVANIFQGDTLLIAPSNAGQEYDVTAGNVVFERDFVSDRTINIELADATLNTIHNVPAEDLVNSDFFSFKVKKNEGSKIIKSIAVKEKTVANGRKPVIEIKLKEDMTDNDYKVDLDFSFSVKQKWLDEHKITATTDTGDKVLGSAKFYVNNDSLELDRDWEAGSTGNMAKPVKNEDNEVTWEDRNKTVAWLTFFGDSSTNKFYPKLSTVWGHQTYATYFNDTDAFTYDFVGNPKISSTSRATLELLNPFIDEDGDVEVDSENIRIYTPGDTATAGTATDELVAALEDGRLVDITDQFTYEENEDGEYVFVTKTRTLGTYIVVDVTDLDSYITDDTNDEIIDDVPSTSAPIEKLPPVTGNF